MTRTAGNPRSFRLCELSDDDSDAVLLLNGAGPSSMMSGTSREGEETLLLSQVDAAPISEW